MGSRIFFDVYRASMVPETFSQGQLLVRGDPFSGNLVLADKDGFLLTPSEFYAIVSRVNGFYESGYTDERIEELNADWAEDRGIRCKSKKKIDDYCDRSGKVYLIRADNGLYKIGCSTKIERRFKTLRTQSPCEIELIYAIEVLDRFEVENFLHRTFHKKRVKGEWFELEESDVESVEILIQDFIALEEK